VVIPVYRSAAVLPTLHQQLMMVLPSLSDRYEIIFVEDCGGDNSWEVIESLSRQCSNIRGIKLARNFGQHNALLCGIREARGDFIVTMDDDLQNPPEEIPNLLAKLNEGYDVVYGSPAKERHGLMRDLASKITKMVLQGAMGANTARKISAFRVFRTPVRNAFAAYGSPFVNIDVLLTWGTTRFTALNVRHEKRAVGDSGYTVRKLIIHAINMMTGFSTMPLQIASVMGFIFSLFGFFVLAYVLVGYFINGVSVPGFTFIASVIAIFSGAQLFALGIMGEYLARMHFRTMERPPFVVGALTGRNDES
jgi:undecaprenyl-phosphate 4-deoxy-4-formamido-L-arabinose transferase